MKRYALISVLLAFFTYQAWATENLTQFVNPFLGTATLWTQQDLQYERKRETRTWGGETFPGSSLPHAMVQLTPVTMYRSGAGYQYEDKQIYGFAHTCKGHWNLLHLPLLPTNAERVNADDFASPFSHHNESAHPGYYQVYLERYGINAELTSTLRCGYHKYTFKPGDRKRLIADMTRTNNHVREWAIEKVGEHSFSGYQHADGKIYFYAISNYAVDHIGRLQGRNHTVSVVDFKNSTTQQPLELKIGFSFVSVAGAKANLEAEMRQKDFEQVRKEADQTWEALLNKIQVTGGTKRQKRLFYSCLYRSCLWPCLRSDVNKDYTDARGNTVNNGFHYYTNPSFWDDYRNKLVLIGLIEPEITVDILRSLIDEGEKRNGYMPTFFHGDHASTFVAGSYQRGLRGFDLNRAYQLILKNATVPGRGGRPYLDEYLKQGWIAEKDTTQVPYYDEYKAAVTKTLEYAYDDYATAQVAKILGDTKNYKLLMKHSQNYQNVFDPSTGFFRGRIADGSFIKEFDPYYPYFAYMYRESNAWNNLFFAPHDIPGIIRLYPNKKTIEKKLDKMFSEPWRGYEVENLTGFIGNYCHGNQPGHSIPYMYYFVGRQDKAQCVLDSIMNHYYDMGEDRLALAGMDDAGEMSSWFVFNAMGLYTLSPADPEYIVTVPLFDQVKFTLNDGKTFTIRKQGKGNKIQRIEYGGKRLKGWFIQDAALQQGRELTIVTAPGDCQK